MTKFILAGGNDRKYESYGTTLAKEIRKSIKDPVILSCFFSSDETTWQEKSWDWHNWFRNFFGPKIEYCVAAPDIFLEQIEQADLIYLHGGRTLQLLNVLPNFEQIRNAFEGKIVIGSSAGANYLAKAGYSPSADNFRAGSGIVDINVIVHYGAAEVNGNQKNTRDWQEVYKRFQQHLDSQDKIVSLPEGEFVILEQI